jgi:sortase A
MPQLSARTLAILSRILVGVGVLCLGTYAWAHVRAFRFAQSETARLRPLLGREARHASNSAALARAEARPGRAFGMIQLPERDFAALIAEGVDDDTLSVAVGHLPGTGFPGEPGNVALAAHRDTFFRVLRKVKPGELIRISTPDGVFAYRVEWAEALQPTRTDVVAEAHGERALTLVTCYPFGYIGRAPLRYVVRARQLPSEADPASPR